MSALALIVAATLAQAGTLRSDLALRGGGAGRSVVALSAWDKGGSQDWGVGIPSPTIDCAAVGTSSSASLQCSGATPSFAGSGQTAAGSPWWYRGDASVRPSIVLNGSTDYWDLGDVGDPDTDLAACVGWRNNATGVQSLWGKYAAAGKGWIIYTNTTAVVVEVCKAGPACTSITLAGANVAGAFTQACFGYDYVADGTSVLRLVVNGVAATAVTNAVGPIANVATTLRLGSDGYDERVNGAIRRGAIWTGADAPTSAAQLAQMVATQWGLAADKPSGTVATHARTDSTLCCPFSDAECYTVGPGAPCIHAPTYAGWASGGTVAGGIEVFGAAANALARSDDVSVSPWAKYGLGAASPTIGAAVAGPYGSNTGRSIAFAATNTGQYSIIEATLTGTAAPWTCSAWLRSDTPGTLYMGINIAGTGAYKACTVGTTFTRCSVTGTLTAATWAFDVGPDSRAATGQPSTQAALTATVADPQCTPTAYPVPYRATTGTAYSGSASTATTLTVPVALTDPARWAIGATGSMGSWATAFADLLALGTDGQANTAHLTSYNGGAYWQITDATAATKTWNIASHGYAAGSQHTWLGSSDGRFWADGALLATTASGTGTGVLSALPATLNIGYGGGASGGSLNINGLVSRVVQCKRAGGCR